MTVVETLSFLRDAKRLMDEAERLEIVSFLARNPDAGGVMRGTGGIRKVRFAREGRKNGIFKGNIANYTLHTFLKINTYCDL